MSDLQRDQVLLAGGRSNLRGANHSQLSSLFDLEALSAPALSQLIDGGMTTAVVPFGSVEHHGGHLPLGADAMLADAVGREVAARLGGVLLPTVRFGDSAAHEELSGTITMNSATLTRIAVELSRSLARTGFAVIVLLSTHGGNRQGLDAAVERLMGMSDAVVCATHGNFGPAPGSYSGEWLTSVMLALHPDLVDVTNAAENLRDELQVVDAERGRQHFERFVASSVQAVIDAIG